MTRPLIMALNELSLITATSRAEAYRIASGLVHTLKSASDRGVPKELHVSSNFFMHELSPQYYWKSWLQDPLIDRDTKSYFRSLTTKVPYLSHDIGLSASAMDMDCRYKEKHAIGMRAAYLCDGLAISLATNSDWDCDRVECNLERIENDELVHHSEFVRHASAPRHIEQNTEWILMRTISLATDGPRIWELRESLYPNLRFCNGVEAQLQKLPDDALSFVVRGLFALNEYSLHWSNGPYTPDAVKCRVSPESKPTLEKYGQEREFNILDGTRKLFTWHAKLGHWRIHFDPDFGPSKLLVGYIGAHLRTVKHSN